MLSLKLRLAKKFGTSLTMSDCLKSSVVTLGCTKSN